ncbi:hypothetical protein VCR12J2_1030074 [Vibrio coralliirubri]|nr:hypothetical protein [Vibrio coralliirubri]CDT80667.1 hypothetical protein VCR12J2_1030074 [Vibrio coralliirubri]
MNKKLISRIERDRRKRDETVFIGTTYDLMKREGTAEEAASRRKKEADS